MVCTPACLGFRLYPGLAACGPELHQHWRSLLHYKWGSAITTELGQQCSTRATACEGPQDHSFSKRGDAKHKYCRPSLYSHSIQLAFCSWSCRFTSPGSYRSRSSAPYSKSAGLCRCEMHAYSRIAKTLNILYMLLKCIVLYQTRGGVISTDLHPGLNSVWVSGRRNSLPGAFTAHSPGAADAAGRVGGQRRAAADWLWGHHRIFLGRHPLGHGHGRVWRCAPTPNKPVSQFHMTRDHWRQLCRRS